MWRCSWYQFVWQIAWPSSKTFWSVLALTINRTRLYMENVASCLLSAFNREDEDNTFTLSLNMSVSSRSHGKPSWTSFATQSTKSPSPRVCWILARGEKIWKGSDPWHDCSGMTSKTMRHDTWKHLQRLCHRPDFWDCPSPSSLLRQGPAGGHSDIHTARNEYLRYSPDRRRWCEKILCSCCGYLFVITSPDVAFSMTFFCLTRVSLASSARKLFGSAQRARINKETPARAIEVVWGLGQIWGPSERSRIVS